MRQALLFNFSAIIYHLSPHLSSSFRLDGGERTFSGFSRHIWLGSSPGCGWATQRHSQRCISHSCCVLRVTVLLEGKHSAQSEVLNTLDWVFIKGISIFWCIELFFYSDESLGLCCWKTAPQYELLPAHFTFGMVLCMWWAELVMEPARRSVLFVSNVFH